MCKKYMCELHHKENWQVNMSFFGTIQASLAPPLDIFRNEQF